MQTGRQSLVQNEFLMILPATQRDEADTAQRMVNKTAVEVVSAFALHCDALIRKRA